MNNFRKKMIKVPAVLLLSFGIALPTMAVAQDHVVASSQIQSDVSSATAVRQQNERQLKSFLSTSEMQRMMKSEGVDPQQVTSAVSQLNNADLARLAAQSAHAQKDFAAGRMSNLVFFLLGAAIVAIILIVVFG